MLRERCYNNISQFKEFITYKYIVHGGNFAIHKGRYL